MRYKQAIHLLAFFSLVTFVFIPSTLYLFNSNQWNYDYYPVLFFLVLGLGSLVLLFSVYYLINKISSKYALIFTYATFSFGLIILLNDMLSPVQLGLLDGSSIYSNEPLLYTLLESIVTVLVLLFSFFFLRKNQKWIYIITRPIYFLGLGLVISCFIFQGNSFGSKGNQDTTHNKSKLYNIYHFHIDGMQTDYFLRYINNNPEVRKKLVGFTLFEKNIANYHSTMLSLPSFLTSTTHLNGRFDKWLKKYDEGLFRELKQLGYKLIHNSNAPHRSKYFDEIIAVPELLKKYNGAEHLSIVEFTRIWLAKVAPNFLTNESLIFGKRLGKSFFQKLNPEHDMDIALTIEDGTAALSGILLFKDMITDIDYYTDANQYVFSLNSILHDGYVSSPECTIEEKPEFPLAKRYYRQLECAMMLVEEFIDKLKSLDRYDDSLIIIHGDHGSSFAGQLLENQGSSFVTNMDSADDSPFDSSIAMHKLTVLESKARALLMIKPFFRRGDMEVSSAPTQLLDIFPTIMGQLGIDNLKDIEGVDIFSKKELKNRQRYFYYMSPSRHETQIKNYHKMVPKYDRESGILSLISQSRGKTTPISFFKNGENIKKYKDIRFYPTYINGNIITDTDWIFFSGIDTFNHWGAWTKSEKVTIAFVPEDAKFDGYSNITLKINDVFINDQNQKITANFILNKTPIGSLIFSSPKTQYSFPRTVKFQLPENIILIGHPNILEIDIEGANSEKNLGIGNDLRRLGLALVELSLR